MHIAFMLSILLLPIGIASGAYGVSALAQTSIPVTSEAVEALAGKSLSYWFIALALFSISSWTVIVKWLLSQLMEQRKANAEVTTQLINYMKDDHANTKVLLEKVETSNIRLSTVLDKLLPKQ